jgi:hypothetical protein
MEHAMFIIDEKGNAVYADHQAWTRWVDRKRNEDLLVGRHHVVRNTDGLVFEVSDNANLRNLEKIITVETKFNQYPAFGALVWETRAGDELEGSSSARAAAVSFHNRTVYRMVKKYQSQK